MPLCQRLQMGSKIMSLTGWFGQHNIGEQTNLKGLQASFTFSSANSPWSLIPALHTSQMIFCTSLSWKIRDQVLVISVPNIPHYTLFITDTQHMLIRSERKPSLLFWPYPESRIKKKRLIKCSWNVCMVTGDFNSINPSVFPLKLSLRAGYKAVAVVQSLSHTQLSVTPWTAACQASLTFTISWSLLNLMSIELVMLSNPSHPLSLPSPPALHLSQHQGLFQWVSSSHQVAKILELQLQHQSFQWIFRFDFL